MIYTGKFFQKPNSVFSKIDVFYVALEDQLRETIKLMHVYWA